MFMFKSVIESGFQVEIRDAEERRVADARAIQRFCSPNHPPPRRAPRRLGRLPTRR